MQHRKLSLKERYNFLTRDLDWQTTYQPMHKVFPYSDYEGIKIRDWDRWEDPFRLTMDAYWKYQAEKDKKLYAVLDSFAQHNGHLNVSDGRYVNALKLFLQGISPLEYQAHRGFAFIGRHFPGAGTRVACQMQSLDELRHVQTQIHTISHYNKYFNGMHSFPRMHDRLWYLSIPKSYFEDARTAGPFEFLVAIAFSFEYVFTNLLFVPFMSGAAFNGDMATVTFGFSAQSDEARHMTLGLEAIKFVLEQHEDNVPIIQAYLDKWLWRGFRLLSLVGTMMDYMLPRKIMPWREAWEMYFEENGGALFEDLSRYGIKVPQSAAIANAAKHRISHELWSVLYTARHALGLHVWMPTDEEMDWLSASYPDTFDRYYRPRFEYWKSLEKEGRPFQNAGLPQLCQVCQFPTLFSEPDDPTEMAMRMTTFEGDRYWFCSDGCKTIFEHEPEKYVSAWLPVHQMYQGHCGGSSLEEIVAWSGVDPQDTGLYEGSKDQQNWEKWKGLITPASTKKASLG